MADNSDPKTSDSPDDAEGEVFSEDPDTGTGHDGLTPELREFADELAFEQAVSSADLGTDPGADLEPAAGTPGTDGDPGDTAGGEVQPVLRLPDLRGALVEAPATEADAEPVDVPYTEVPYTEVRVQPVEAPSAETGAETGDETGAETGAEWSDAPADALSIQSLAWEFGAAAEAPPADAEPLAVAVEASPAEMGDETGAEWPGAPVDVAYTEVDTRRLGAAPEAAADDDPDDGTADPGASRAAAVGVDLGIGAVFSIDPDQVGDGLAAACDWLEGTGGSAGGWFAGAVGGTVGWMSDTVTDTGADAVTDIGAWFSGAAVDGEAWASAMGAAIERVWGDSAGAADDWLEHAGGTIAGGLESAGAAIGSGADSVGGAIAAVFSGRRPSPIRELPADDRSATDIGFDALDETSDLGLAEAQPEAEAPAPRIARFRALFRRRLMEGAHLAGWPLEKVPDLAKMAEVPFFFLLGRGAPVQVAMLAAIFVADKLMAVDQMTRTVAAGFTPPQAFAEIRGMRLNSAAGIEDGDAMAAAATAKFDAALAAGRTPEQALSDAFDAASEVFYGKPAA